MIRIYQFTVAGTPKSVNAGGGGSRAHWSKAHKEKKYWEELFGTEFMIAKVQRGMLFCSVDVVLRFKGQHRRDSENYRHPVAKPFADALVKLGYLPDDTDEFFRIGRFQVQAGIRDAGTMLMKSEMRIRMEAIYA